MTEGYCGEIDANENEIDSEIKTIMLNHDIDQDTAERVQELIDEGLDEDEAAEFVDLL